jgi:YYY domain-containing protein
MSEDTQSLIDRATSQPLRGPFGGLSGATARPAVRIGTESFLIGVALFTILVFAGLLRLTALNWDANHHLHPDERHNTSTATDTKVPGSLALYFNTAKSPMNPYNAGKESYVYGTVPLFMTKVAANLTGPLPFVGNYAVYDGFAIVGRALAAFFDIGTVFFAFLLGRRLFGARAGLLAALLYAFSPLPIQHAHFFVADAFMTFFTTAAIYYAVRIVQNGKWSDYAWAGAMVGLAVASKLTAVSLVPVVMLAGGIRAWPSISQLWGSSTLASIDTSQTISRAVRGSLLALGVAFLLFRVGQPYAFNAPGLNDLAIWQDDFECVNHTCGALTNAVGQVLDLNPKFVDDQVEQQGLLAGGNWPPNVQWIGRTPWIYPLQQMILWGMGPLLGVAGWLGMFYLAWRLFKRRELVLLVPLAWVAGYFFYMGGQFTLYLRYFLPLYPTLAVSAAAALLALWGWAANAGLPAAIRARVKLPPELLPSAIRTLAVAVPVVTILWGLAYFHIYSQPTTRNTASAWIYANVPAGATIATEHWDDGLPFPEAGIGDASKYNNIVMNNYDLDSQAKVDQLLQNIDQADVIAISSDRLVKTIPRAPANYPVTTKFYEELFAGKLGFRLAKQFTSYPEVLGVSIPDRGAEEAWNVYDHPPVEVFIKTKDYSHNKAVAILSADAFVDPVGLSPTDAGRNALLFTPKDLAIQQAGGTFSDIFDKDSIANHFPLITWLLVVELISFAALPATLLLFRGLPDRGYLLSKPIGFLVLGYVVWLGATLHAVQFSRGIIATDLVIMALIGAAIAYLTKDNLRTFFRTRWREIVLWEALFLGAFLFFYIIRLNDPDLWHPGRGGEKPMDFAYFIAMTRAVHLPPPDPWFAGGYMNYYYFGQFLTAMITKFTGIMPEVAYNLAVPLFFSLAVVATYSLGFNLAEATRRGLRWRPDRRRIGPRGPVFAGFGAVVLVVLIGNLGGMQQLVNNFSAISPWHVDAPVLGGIVGFFGGIKAMLIDGKSVPLGTDWYWGPSRMMPPTISITEFPYFTFLFADLHAHLMAIPFAITSLAVGAALVLNATRLVRPPGRGAGAGGGSVSSAELERERAELDTYRRWASWAMVVLLALIVGALRWINSWDYPTFLLVAVCAVFIAERATAGRFDFAALRQAVLKSAVLVALTMILFLPFQAHYQLPATGFHQLEEREVTPFHQYAAHFGVFLFFIGSFAGFLSYRRIRRSGGAAFMGWLVFAFAGLLLLGTFIAGTIGWLFDTLPMPFYIHDLTASGFLRVVVGGILAPLPGSPPIATTDGQRAEHTTPVVAFVLFALALLAILAWSGGRKRPRSDGSVMMYIFSMLGVALFLSAGVELVTLDFDIQRMNTVFKFYIHAWVLFAVVSAFGGWYLLDVVRPRIDLSVPVSQLRQTKLRPAQLAAGAFAICATGFVMAALVYTFVATHQRVLDRFDNTGAVRVRTDDGLAYMRGAQFGDQSATIDLVDDYEGIQWMRDNVAGTPTIIEGITPLYRWGGRYSINTGLPTVLGWEWHQTQQREKFQQLITARKADVDNFYQSSDVAAQQHILKKYGVSYVIVGEVEKLYYAGRGLDNIDASLGGMLDKVYQYGETSIYRVRPNPLLASAASQ